MKTIKAKIKLIEGGKKPFKATPNSACLDLYAREIIMVNHLLYKVKLGVAIEPQEGYRVALYPRSSISKTGWILANSIGIGDNDYRGEYLAYFTRIDKNKPFPYSVGDRVCQFELVPYNDIEIEYVVELSDTHRGNGGHGSSGK